VKKETFSQKVPGKRRSFRLIPVAVVLVVVAVFFTVGGLARVDRLFADMSMFKIRSVEFAGCESASAMRLRALAEITLYQTSMIGLDDQAVEARIEKDPWVSKAVLKRDWPSKIIIEVVEHTPISMINTGTNDDPHLYYVDSAGTAFLQVIPGHDVDYPVITGLDEGRGGKEREEIFADIRTFLKLAGRNNPNLPAQAVSEIHVNKEGEIVVFLVDHTFPIFFGRGQIGEKYSRLVKVLDALYKEKRKGMLISGVEYIRMDYLNDKVLVAQSESG
jgi:cell division protein FtsQ